MLFVQPKEYMLIVKSTGKPSLCVAAIMLITGKRLQECLALVEAMQYRKKDIIVKSRITYQQALDYRRVFAKTESIVLILPERLYAKMVSKREEGYHGES